VKNTFWFCGVLKVMKLDAGHWSITRSSADADNGLDTFVGQWRSTNILGPFQVK